VGHRFGFWEFDKKRLLVGGGNYFLYFSRFPVFQYLLFRSFPKNQKRLEHWHSVDSRHPRNRQDGLEGLIGKEEEERGNWFGEKRGGLHQEKERRR